MIKKLLLTVMVLCSAFGSVAAYACVDLFVCDPNQRCRDGGLPKEKCELVRSASIQQGCISDDDAKKLATAGDASLGGAYPVCMAGIWTSTCPCGCFASFINLLVQEKGAEAMTWLPAETLYDQHDKYNIVSLTSDSTSFGQGLHFNSLPIRKRTVGPEDKPVFEISTEDNRKLVLTRLHGVLVSAGEVIQAKDLTLDHQLVRQDGTFARITKIDQKMYKGNVYNFEADAKTLPNHLIVAEGYVVGDLAWQNYLTVLLGRVAIRQ